MSDPRESTCCKNCGAKIRQQSVKALDGNWAMCWVAEDGEWICEDDANEHEPESPDSTYRRDLDFATEGMTASELLVDAVFNDVVSDVENHGHSRTRIERDLRAWIEDEGAETLMAPLEALTYAILAINTAEAPDATSAEDLRYLDDNAERALHMLDKIRDWVIAQGEDFVRIGLGIDDEI